MYKAFPLNFDIFSVNVTLPKEAVPLYDSPKWTINLELFSREGFVMSKIVEMSEEQQQAVRILKEEPTEEHLWEAVAAFRNYTFFTASGLPYSYQLKMGKNGHFTHELLIDRRQNSKTLAWSSVCLAFRHALEKKASPDPAVRLSRRPKSLGDIRGISYIYPILWKFDLIEVPEKYAIQMSGESVQYRLFE